MSMHMNSQMITALVFWLFCIKFFSEIIYSISSLCTSESAVFFQYQLSKKITDVDLLY